MSGNYELIITTCATKLDIFQSGTKSTAISRTSKGAKVKLGLSKATAGETTAEGVAARLAESRERTSGITVEVGGERKSDVWKGKH